MGDHFISYKLQRDFTPGNADWIGLFSDEFSSLDDYIVYEYINRGEFTIPFYLPDLVFWCYHCYSKTYIYIFLIGKSTLIPGEAAGTERIFYSDTALRLTETYCLVYVAQRGDLTEILGVSPPFSGPRKLIDAAVSL